MFYIYRYPNCHGCERTVRGCGLTLAGEGRASPAAYWENFTVIWRDRRMGRGAGGRGEGRVTDWSPATGQGLIYRAIRVGVCLFIYYSTLRFNLCRPRKGESRRKGKARGKKRGRGRAKGTADR